MSGVAPHPYRTPAPSEPESEPRELAGWGEDLFLVALFALVGALGMVAGTATDSPVEVCIGLVLVIFAAKVLFDVLRARRVFTRSADPARTRDGGAARDVPGDRQGT